MKESNFLTKVIKRANGTKWKNEMVKWTKNEAIEVWRWNYCFAMKFVKKKLTERNRSKKKLNMKQKCFQEEEKEKKIVILRRTFETKLTERNETYGMILKWNVWALPW